MREFKFRIYVCDDKKIYYTNDFENFEITLDGSIHYFQNCIDGDFGTDYLTHNKNCFLMQWTGLTDKNGKDIYEGDILNNSNGDVFGIIIKNIFEVIKITKEGTFVGTFDSSLYEVIGNIYENGELLEDNKC